MFWNLSRYLCHLGWWIKFWLKFISIFVYQELFLALTMSDHLVLCVDRLITTETVQSLRAADTERPSGEGSSSSSSSSSPPPPQSVHHPSTSAIEVAEDDHDFPEGDEEDPLIQNVECRICQEEDSIKNLETPCACSGSLKVYN